MDKPPTKKRKLTDRTLPPSVPNSEVYNALLDMERNLDWTMSRKKAELVDSLSKALKTQRTLRVFLSHTVSNQPWQIPEGEAPAPNLETGEGIPSWTFRIEGKILDPSPSGPQRKFSQFLKSLIIEIDRDPSLIPGGNIVEWHRPQPPPAGGQAPATQEHDAFTITKQGDTPVKLRIVLHLNQVPDRFTIHPELGAILDVKEESRTGVLGAFWNYVKVHGLQDKHDRKLIKLDPRLQAVFRQEMIFFRDIPSIINRFVQPPEPVKLYYMITVDKDSNTPIITATTGGDATAEGGAENAAEGAEDSGEHKDVVMGEDVVEGAKEDEEKGEKTVEGDQDEGEKGEEADKEEGGDAKPDAAATTSADASKAPTTSTTSPSAATTGASNSGNKMPPNTIAFDIPLDTDDGALRSKMTAVVAGMSGDAAKALTDLDEELANTAQAIRNAKLKHTFLHQLAASDAGSKEEKYKMTAEFVNTWLGSQSRDLEVMLGNERGPAMEGWSGDFGGVSQGGRGVREEDLHRSEFFRQPWVAEAVAIHEGVRVGGALSQLQAVQAPGQPGQVGR